MLATGISQKLRAKVYASSEMRKAGVSLRGICIKEVGKGVGDFIRITLSVLIGEGLLKLNLGDFPIGHKSFDEDRVVDKVFYRIEEAVIRVVTGSNLETENCLFVEQDRAVARNKFLLETLGDAYFGEELIGEWTKTAAYPEDLLSAKELWGVFMGAFSVMGKRDRAVIMMRSAGKTFREIGEDLKISSDRARVLFEQIKKKLLVWRDYSLNECGIEADFPIGKVTRINTPFVLSRGDGNYRVQKVIERRGIGRVIGRFEEVKIGTNKERLATTMAGEFNSFRRSLW